MNQFQMNSSSYIFLLSYGLHLIQLDKLCILFVTIFAVLFRSVEYFTALPYNYPVVISIRLWIIPLTAGNSIDVTELWRTTWSKSIRFQIKFGFQETEVFIALRTGNVRYKQNMYNASSCYKLQTAVAKNKKISEVAK